MASNESKNFSFLDRGGELGALTRAHDWSSTSLGPVDQWPQTLKSIVGMLLQSRFPMFLWWGEEMIQFYNDAYRPSLGNNGKHPTALGQKAIDCWPEIWDIIYPLIQQVRTKNESIYFEDTLVPIYRNGQIEDVYWTFSYSAIIGETGQVDGVLVVCTETTEKVRSRQTLENVQKQISRSEATLRNVILQSPVAMCILKGPQHVVEIANDRMLELWGVSAQEIIGIPLFQRLTDARDEYEHLLDHVLSSGETYSAYGRPTVLYRNGVPHTVYGHFVYEPFRDDGTIVGVMVVVTDVTEAINSRQKLEQSETTLRNIVETAPFPIGVYEGREMRISQVNQSLIDVWGKGDDLIGKTFYETLPELGSQGFFKVLDKVFTTGIPHHGRNERVDLIMDGDLQPFYFNYSYTPLRDSSGHVYGVLNTAADVTDLVVAMQRVERSEANFRTLVQTAPVAMCILLGPDLVVDIANDLIIQLWGKPPEQVMHKPIFEGLPDAKGQGLEELLQKVYRTGESFTATERPVNLMRNGKVETVFQTFAYEPYRDADGTILGVLAITIDATAQVVARQRIEEIVKDRTEDLRKTNADLSQFAYIASHDLQEPARKITTFIDMLRKSLGEHVDDRSSGFLDKIERSSKRMLTLIRDVLAFSTIRTDKQNFVKIDLNEVLASVESDFELVIQERDAVIEHMALPVIEAIPIQMSQLFGNLISNALKFIERQKQPFIQITWEALTPEEVHSYDLESSRAYIRLSFADNGIGFNQENADQIFNIFQRLHGKSDYEGTGIGLAICKKIAENHGGKIEAVSTLGGGATFRIVLPLRQSA